MDAKGRGGLEPLVLIRRALPFMATAGRDLAGEARALDHPGPRWIVEDLAQLDLPARGISECFDAIVVGSVMTFLAPSTRVEVLRRLGGHVHAEGRVVIGFGADRDYQFSAFLTNAREVGLEPELLLPTWDVRPWSEDSEFLVVLLRPV